MTEYEVKKQPRRLRNRWCWRVGPIVQPDGSLMFEGGWAFTRRRAERDAQKVAEKLPAPNALGIFIREVPLHRNYLPLFFEEFEKIVDLREESSIDSPYDHGEGD